MEKLSNWQNRLAQSDAAYSAEVAKMNDRERLYNGENTIRPMIADDMKTEGVKRTSHVRNIIFENIESQINTTIPLPKVTPRKKEDEKLAEIIENFLRNELDRLPFEMINDMAERTVPIQGGVGFLVEWDNAKSTRLTVGEVSVGTVHPKQFAPQPGIYTSIEDMDWFIVKIPTTKEEIRRRYGVEVYSEGESEPGLRGIGGSGAGEDSVTQYVGYEKDGSGGINRYSWVNDVELEDLNNYQARRQPVCSGCEKGRPPEEDSPCPHCGGKKVISREIEHETIYMPDGKSVEAPFYRPDLYPVILQRSVSVYGQLLGNSDVDVIRDQQNTINRMEQKIIDRLLKAGTRITLPDRADLRTDPEDGERWYITPADRELIGIYDFSGDISSSMAYMQSVYEEARQIIGITDSFQGRRDTTATSGRAKEIAAAQTAGRLESKRVMKEAAYAKLFEMMFKFWLAYSDEPRTVVYKGYNGDNEYLQFNRYDFLEQDTNGEWHWNDQFLFSTDSSSQLATNREAMWHETRVNLQSGAFGNPSELETLIMFWSKMEELHYPGAGGTRKFLEERLEKAEEQAEQMPPGMDAMQGLPLMPMPENR
jgi:hypothetical protein